MGYGLAKDILGKAGLGKIIGLWMCTAAGKTGKGGSVQTQVAQCEHRWIVLRIMLCYEIKLLFNLLSTIS